jgi:hypothetical protein
VGKEERKACSINNHKLELRYFPKQKKYSAISDKDYLTHLSQHPQLPVRTGKPGQTTQHNLASLYEAIMFF